MGRNILTRVIIGYTCVIFTNSAKTLDKLAVTLTPSN